MFPERLRGKPDWKLIKDHPQKLALEGKVANIPFVSGNNDDEGTLFTFPLTNLTTDAEVKDYIHSNYFPKQPRAITDLIADQYPQDPSDGSPFDTGSSNAISPQYKRLAAFQGDLGFQGPRRFFLNLRSIQQPIWSFLNKRMKNTQILGSFHGSDLLQTIDGHAELQDYLINFVNHLDPNVGSNPNKTLINWPRYNPFSKSLLMMSDSSPALSITKDDYREKAIGLITAVSLVEPPYH